LFGATLRRYRDFCSEDASMPIIENLGTFYLGKEYDLKARHALDRPVNYDSRDLTTHAVCVGMTGSGKTGLCISLLEEAAIDGVPAIIIDPKGDIANLLLTFPDLRAEDFLPWINADDARRTGKTPTDYAAQVAATWRDGLAASDEGPERIRLLRNAAEFVIYTPGSEAGRPVNVLSSFQAPRGENGAAADWDADAELFRERIRGTVSALLGLIGIEADPVRSREHILLSNIFEAAWREGQDLDIPRLILAVQNPPFRKLGVFDLDSFFSEKDRFTLAMALNSIIASPSFEAWLRGEPLDIDALLHAPNGKPRHSIFSIAHLSDAERMFFVTILLEQIISWMRLQPGTSSLRALMYMDEVFGFFPPVAEPPSKRPMLTLLKQARAFGLGLVLATQNPVDLDYKGLTNAGTWFIGKLQAERDKARLMAGLQDVLSGSGGQSDLPSLDKLISSLETRVFLLHDINLPSPIVFQTRWAMSYLRGPLTRAQIRQLAQPDRSDEQEGRTIADEAMPGAPAASSVLTPKAAQPPASSWMPNADVTPVVPTTPATPQTASSQTAAQNTPTGPAQDDYSAQPPLLPPGVKQVYLPLALTADQAAAAVARTAGVQAPPDAARLVYVPALLGFATVRFADRKLNVDVQQDYSLLLPLSPSAAVIAWKDAHFVPLEPADIGDRPAPDGVFAGELPAGVTDVRSLTRLSSDFSDYLYRNQVYTLAYNPTLKLYARPGESDRDFRVRCQQAAREARDAAVDILRDKFETQLARLEERLRREEQDLADNEAEYKGRQREETLTNLATVVGMFGLLGRRSRSARGLSVMATKHRLTGQAHAGIAESEADIARLQAQMDDIKSQMADEAGALTQQWSAAVDDVQAMRITPRKSDISVQMVAPAWAPGWEITYRDARGRARTDNLPAYPGTQL
jgi:hypothetical protein